MLFKKKMNTNKLVKTKNNNKIINNSFIEFI